ncbi:MAG: histidine kinase [Tannerellaceae bacterium]|nr:histidine kinase [Tannerellaceae bacterium]
MGKRLQEAHIGLLAIISIVVACLMYFPEIVSLVDSDMTDVFPGMEPADVINEVFFTFFSLILLFALNIFIFGYARTAVPVTWQKVCLSFAVTWLLSSLLGKSFFYIHRLLDIPAVDAIVHYNLYPFRDFLLTCIVTGCCYVLYLNKRNREVQLENQQLQAENLLNQYEALKSQLNPHMLFNSLNTLRSLIRETPDKAQDYLQQLSKVLRYTLQENDNKVVTLQEEMEFVEAFIFMLKMRYEENIMFEIDVPGELFSKVLPPMSVQLLVENSVKHNEISSRHPLTVQIRATGHSLTVSNPIQPKRTPYVGTGIGLANLGKRYQLLFKQDIVVNKEDNQFCVTIPLNNTEI